MAALVSVDEEDTVGGLSVGDCITFFDAKFQNYLGAEGILIADVTANVPSPDADFDDNLLCIHLQRQYSAARELQSFQDTYHVDLADRGDKKLDEGTKKYLAALENGRNNEVELNDIYLKKQSGDPIHFGDIIQLFHVKSQKYLTVDPLQLASYERENNRVILSGEGNIYSWFKLMPRYKIDREGDRVRSGADLYIALAEKPNEYIRVADAPPRSGYPREVNCSLISTSWKVDLFESYTTAKDESLVFASQLVYIFDPETLSNLAIAFPELESFDEDEADKKDGDESVGGSRSLAIEDENVGEKQDEQGKEEYIHAYGNVVIKASGDGIADARTLWHIEPELATSGGPIVWKTSKIRFRNVATGLYLHMKAKDDTTPLSHDNCVLVSTDDPSIDGTLFTFYEPNSTIKFLHNLKALSICSAVGGVWLGRGEAIELSFGVKGVKDRNAALNFVVNPLKLAHPEIFSGNKPLDEHTALNAKKYFKRYLDMSVIPKNNSVSTIWPKAERSDIPFFYRLFESLTNYSQGYDIDAHVQLGVDPFDPLLRTQRQRLLRELDVLEMALRIIHRLIPISVMVENQQLKKTKLVEEEENLMRMGNNVLDTVFKFVYYSILDNPENQMFVVTFLKVLLMHLSTQKLAGKCVTEMLSKNMELQETKIGEPEISIFVEKLRTSKMNSMYLNLLQSCCSCEGQGVDNNQCLVAKLLFEDTNDIIIELHVDFAKATRVNWNIESIYIPNPPIPGSPLLGEVLLTKGLPLLSLAWTTNAIDYSPLGLFGKLSVNVGELYAPSIPKIEKKKTMDATLKEKSAAQIKLEEKKNASANQKAAVATYFINEMFLGAEMCMDRNYVAMHKLDPYFSFESLVAILKMDVQESVKAGAARLLLCLHIDRDPQAETQIPILTRTWTNVERNEMPQLPYVDPSRRFVYGLVQELISEHVRSMAGRKWEPYSKYILEILLSMAKFNFYGTIERMHDIIYPLIAAVDRRLVNYAGDKKKIRSPDETGENLDVSGQFDDLVKEEDKLAEKLESWQFHTLEFFGSMPYMSSVLIFVLATVAITIYQVSAVATVKVGSSLFIWNVVVTLTFIVEYSVRIYCFNWMYGEPFKFIMYPLNMVDIVVIVIEIACLVLSSTAGNDGDQISGPLSLVRLARLSRVFRVAKVLTFVAKKTKSKRGGDVETWQPPARYSKIPISEMETVMQAQNVLLFVQSVIEDRNLSLLLRNFYAWECGDDNRSPGEIFDQVVLDSSELTLGVQDFDLIFIDLLMMPYKPLVQGSLDVLMAHHSMREKLLENASQVQILVSSKRERQFKIVDQMLQQLERNAETHELWGELKSESDYLTNKQTKDIILELTDICRVRRVELQFDEEFYADRDIQNLFRNLGCFTICFKMLGLLDSVEEPEEVGEEMGEVSANTLELCLLTNELLYWFCLENPLNQELCYSELEFFVETLDSNIKSHKMIRAIFKENETLMKLVPHSYLAKAAENIAKIGHFHQYLALPSSITNVGEKNFTKNQFEIMKTMTAHGKLESISCFLVSATHPDYQEKVDLMAEVAEKERKGFYIEFDDLPSKLAYHFSLLELFSNCTVGRINITSVEAKVQSIYSYEDVLSCLLDPRSIILAKTRLGMHFYNSFVEVEISIPGIELSKLVWALIVTFPAVVEGMHKNLIHIAQAGWSGNQVVRQKIEYAIVCIKIIYGFFGRYYDPNALTPKETATTTATSVKISEADLPTIPTPEEANNLISELYGIINTMYEMRSDNLSQTHKMLLHDALDALNKSALVPFTNEVDISFTEKIVVEEDLDTLYLKDEAREIEVHAKWAEFLKSLDEDEEIKKKIATENRYFISNLEALPFISDEVESDVRYESFIQALVKHILNSITIINGEKRIDTSSTKTSIWIVKAFRTMIENKMGMTIYERDDEGGDEQDIAAHEVVTALNENGATGLCLELIAVGIDETLQNEAIKLIVGMLFKEGGARAVQLKVHTYLSESKRSDLFFKQVRATIGKLVGWHKWNGVITLEEGQDPEPPEDILIIRFLQLLSEGHYLPNQDLMREQLGSSVQINLLDDFVIYLNALSRLPCRTSTNCAIRVAATILEVIQGPCTGNQEHLAMNTEILEIMNRVMRLKDVGDCDPEEELELKKTIIDIFEALLEGRQRKSVVVERILSVIHLDIIQITAKGPSNPDEAPEGSVDLAIECGVLLQILSDFNPMIKAESGLEDEDDEGDGGGNGKSTVEKATACVELNWEGTLNRRFFPIPEVCSLLAKSSKDRLVATVDRSNDESKLIDFLGLTRSLYREAKHQEKLVEMGLARIFSTSNRDNSSWMTFILAWVQNGIFIAYYNVRNAELDPQLPPDIANVSLGINILHICFALFTVILSLVVRSPVVAKSLQDDGCSTLEVVIGTASDLMTVYYFVYLIICILGIAVGGYWIALLLLDVIVKNETSGAVVSAVWVPRQQLGYSMLLGLFLFFIFANFMFRYYQVDFVSYPNLCTTLYDCTKFEIDYGMQMGGGPADLMAQTQSARLWMDIIYFIAVIVIWLNITFGIIIDTFSSLRSDRDERLIKTTEFCFICGMSRQTFDRASDKPDGFATHIREDHNLWAYVYFIFFVWEQDKDDDDGLEYYIRHKIDNNEITWFPMNMAMRLELAETDQEAKTSRLKASVRETRSNFGNKLGDLENDVGTMLEKLAHILKESASMGMPGGGGHHDRGGANDDDVSVGSNDTGNDWYPALGYDVYAAVKEIRGVNLPDEDLALLTCRLISEAGIYAQDGAIINSGRKACIFKNTGPYCMLQNAQSHEKSNFQIQILQGSTVGTTKFIAVVEIAVSDVLQGAASAVLEKQFQIGSQVESATMSLEVKSVKSKVFARGEDDED